MFEIMVHIVVKMEKRSIPIKFNKKKTPCKTQKFYTFFVFFIITIALLIAISHYCHITKYRAKEVLLLFHDTNNNLKQFFINNTNQK